VYDQLPLLLTFGGPTAIYSSLRVVGVRLDPCFPGLAAGGPAPCQTQVRLVFQPLTSGFDADPTASTDDAAVHAFYAVDRGSLESIARELARLRGASGISAQGERLGPHPVIVRQGLSGPFAAGLRALLRQHLGAQNLTRVTFMTLEDHNARWSFGGFDLAPSGGVTPLRTPRIANGARQFFINLDRTGRAYARGAAQPASDSPDELSFFYESATAAGAPRDAQLEAYRRAARIENPALHSPETVDCVSCHTATPARAWAERTLGMSTADAAAHGYDPAGEPLAPLDERETSTSSLRAFGYFGRRPAISRRTVNESVGVARALNAALRSAR
jgi:hypothetical protein